MHIELDDDQAELLRDVLDSAFRDLRYEVADTDNTTYKEKLRPARPCSDRSCRSSAVRCPTDPDGALTAATSSERARGTCRPS